MLVLKIEEKLIDPLVNADYNVTNWLYSVGLEKPSKSWILTGYHTYHYHDLDHLINSITRIFEEKKVLTASINGDIVTARSNKALHVVVSRWVKRHFTK